jgi:hypothetical protein
MICLSCGHYTHADGEMERAQSSGECRCPCHPWNRRPAPAVLIVAADATGAPQRILRQVTSKGRIV